MDTYRIASMRETAMGEDVQMTRQIRGCEDKSCPGVWETSDPETLAVRGVETEAPEGTGAHERVVLIPRSMLADI
jgi:hypothetical protein